MRYLFVSVLALLALAAFGLSANAQTPGNGTSTPSASGTPSGTSTPIGTSTATTPRATSTQGQGGGAVSTPSSTTTQTQGGGVAAPSTGDAGLADNSGGSSAYLIPALLIIAALSGAGIFAGYARSKRS